LLTVELAPGAEAMRMRTTAAILLASAVSGNAAAADEYIYLCESGCGPGAGPIEIVIGSLIVGSLVHLWVQSSTGSDEKLWKVGILAVLSFLFADAGRWVGATIFAVYAAWAWLLLLYRSMNRGRSRKH
jgi:hypothetical protein